MSDNNDKNFHGIVAEYDSVDTLLDACRRVRDAGYTKTDAYTPFAVHGIDKALGIKPTVLPWIVLACGLLGTVTALAMQIWMNAIDYPYIISGKPYISLPAFMPVAFELTVLFASFGAFFGMWALNGLPRYSNPMFTDPRFDRATDDRFFLYVDARDNRFDADAVKSLFSETGGEHIQSVVDDDSSPRIPKPFFVTWGLVAALSIIPLLLVIKMRVTNSSSPRFHVFYDMDFSPAKDAQQGSTLFTDGRAMRPDVPGTVARGELDQDLDFMTGIEMEKLYASDPPRAERLVRLHLNPLMQQEQGGGEGQSQTDDPSQPQDESDKSQESDEAQVESDKTKQDDAADQEATIAGDEVADQEDTAEQVGAAEQGEPVNQSDGADSGEVAEAEPGGDENEQEQDGSEDQEAAAAQPPSVMDTTPWLKENPLPLTREVLQRGQLNFGIYCSVCHGLNGSGNGLVNQRARKILSPTWIPPSSLHQESLYSDQYPDGKLFNTISNGIRKMPGYASQIKARDRWAIVAYVRALQESQNASIELVPEDLREEVLQRKAEVDQKLQEQAEAERQAEQARSEAAEGQAS